jgi:hypothetical protein
MPSHLEAIHRYIDRARAAGDKRAVIVLLREILSQQDAHKIMREMNRA